MMLNDNKTTNYSFAISAVLPDGNGGFTPCPELLTAQEAVRYLRLDTTGSKNALQTLRYYRQQKLLKATRLGRKLIYSKKELNRFIDFLTEKQDFRPDGQEVL